MQECNTVDAKAANVIDDDLFEYGGHGAQTLTVERLITKREIVDECERPIHLVYQSLGASRRG